MAEIKSIFGEFENLYAADAENNLVLTGTLEIKKINNKDVYTYIPLVNE